MKGKFQKKAPIFWKKVLALDYWIRAPWDRRLISCSRMRRMRLFRWKWKPRRMSRQRACASLLLTTGQRRPIASPWMIICRKIGLQTYRSMR